MMNIVPWFDHKHWMDVRDFFRLNPEANKIIIIGENGIGKSYSVEQMVVDYVIQGLHCDWIMNTETEARKMANTLKEVFRKRGVDKDYKFSKEGIFRVEYEEIVNPKTGKTKRIINDDTAELMVGFPYLCSFATSLPNEHEAKLIVIDEFISGNEKRKMVLKDYGSVLRKGVSRLIRPSGTPDNVKMIMMANPHTPEHDLIYSFGIDFNWDNLAAGIDDMQINEEERLVAYCLPKQFDIPEMEASISFCRLGAVSKENYKFYNNSFKRIEPRTDNFKPDFTLTVDVDSHIAFGFDGDKYRCVKAMIGDQKTDRVPHYVNDVAFIVQGYNSKGFLTLDEQVSNLLSTFNGQLLNDNVYFDTCYTKEKCLELAEIMYFNANENNS